MSEDDVTGGRLLLSCSFPPADDVAPNHAHVQYEIRLIIFEQVAPDHVQHMCQMRSDACM